jgi:uncharacterized membrane protein
MSLNHMAAVFRLVHISAGVLALLTFWIPLVARKGGRLHRNVGRIYAWSMGVVAVSALGIVIARLSDADRANDASAIFLGYIALLSFSSARIGIRALRTRARTTASRAARDLALPLVVIVCGLGMAGRAIACGAPLFGVFAGLGIISSVMDLRFWLRAPAKGDFLLQHINGMGASCIATVTAFVVVNAPRLGIPDGNFLIWVTPGVIGGVALGRTLRKYASQFGATS